MFDVQSRFQRRAMRDYTCDLCKYPIKKGCEYIAYTGKDENGWHGTKRHIHCDAIIGRYIEAFSPDGFYSEYEVLQDMRDRACDESVCTRCSNCAIYGCKDMWGLFSCETAVSMYLPEGPIRNAALQSIRDNTGGTDDA